MGLFSKKSSQEVRSEALMNCNIFDGIPVMAEFPDRQLKIRASSGLARGLSTFGFQIVSLNESGDVTQKSLELNTTFEVVGKGIIFKDAITKGRDLRIGYENIINVAEDSEYDVSINLIENQKIPIILYLDKAEYRKYVIEHIIEVINPRACGVELNQSNIETTQKPEIVLDEDAPLMDELERLTNLYKEGFLTDEEFSAFKKKLMEFDKF